MTTYVCIHQGCKDEVQPGLAFCPSHAPINQEPAMKLPHIEADQDFRATMEACDSILTKKGHDYTQGHGRLKNFYTNAQRLGIPARQVLGLYMFKHIDAIETWLRDGAVKSEPIEGRIHDAINYLLLLSKMIRQEARDLKEEARRAVGKDDSEP